MQIREYQVTLIGTSALLMHADNIAWADAMDAWADDPDNKGRSTPGDDRTPAWRWLGALYHENGHVAIPAENIQRALMEGGAMVPVPGGRSGKTFKAQSQSGMAPVEMAWPIEIGNKPIPIEPLLALDREPSFAAHQEKARECGFRLFVKRARIGASKHVRVRPRFDDWSATGTIRVWDDQITPQILQAILTNAGRYKGLCDWRPGSRTPGSFGRFDAKIKPA